jgi:hypothetical protein
MPPHFFKEDIHLLLRQFNTMATINIIKITNTIGNHNGKNTINHPSHQADVDFKNLGKESPQKAHFSVSFNIRKITKSKPPIPIPLEETFVLLLFIF